MIDSLRVMDSGARSARANLSLTEALCRRHKAGTTPDTLRFQHFPPAAIIGRHQSLTREVDLGWVAENSVETARRMTGGGAIVMGPGILGWELVLSRKWVPETLGMVSSTICRGVSNGLRKLGVESSFRPRNDIEVEGRKLCGTGGYFDGGTLVFQGTVLVELDFTLLTHALNLPAHKLERHGIETLADRVTDLKRLMGTPPRLERLQAQLAEGIAEALGLDWHWGQLDEDELAAAQAIHDEEIGTEAFVAGRGDHLAQEGSTLTLSRPTPAGTLDLAVKLLGGQAGMVDQVMITGDFFVSPPRVIADLEAHLRHRPLAGLDSVAMAFLQAQGAAFMGMDAQDIAMALRQVAERWQQAMS